MNQDTPFFSLVLATLGRFEEVERFVESLLTQEFPLDRLELIVVDQNPTPDRLVEILAPFFGRICIVHIHSLQKGLSLNRNIGLEKAKGAWVAFPDDDCTYYPDTLAKLFSLIQTQPQVSLWLGRIWDRKRKRNIIRPWPSGPLSVHAGNFYTLMSSITIFTRRNGVRFDENLGVGARWGANEDADLVLRLLRQGALAQYNPAIDTWHPEQKTDTEEPRKVCSYALGFGAFCRKHWDLRVAVLFFLALAYHFVLGVTRLKRARILAFTYRLVGFWEMHILIRKISTKKR